MTLERIMNADGELDHGSGSPIDGGAFTITSTPSTTTKINGSGVFSGPLEFTFAGGNSTGFLDGSVATVAPQTINPSATEVKADGAAVIRLGDGDAMECVGTYDPPATPATGPVVGPVEVADAGQEVVEAQ